MRQLKFFLRVPLFRLVGASRGGGKVTSEMAYEAPFSRYSHESVFQVPKYALSAASRGPGNGQRDHYARNGKFHYHYGRNGKFHYHYDRNGKFHYHCNGNGNCHYHFAQHCLWLRLPENQVYSHIPIQPGMVMQVPIPPGMVLNLSIQPRMLLNLSIQPRMLLNLSVGMGMGMAIPILPISREKYGDRCTGRGIIRLEIRKRPKIIPRYSTSEFFLSEQDIPRAPRF